MECSSSPLSLYRQCRQAQSVSPASHPTCRFTNTMQSREHLCLSTLPVHGSSSPVHFSGQIDNFSFHFPKCKGREGQHPKDLHPEEYVLSAQSRRNIHWPENLHHSLHAALYSGPQLKICALHLPTCAVYHHLMAINLRSLHRKVSMLLIPLS